MSITVKCDGCGKALKVKDDLAGRRVRCPACDAVVRVPAGQFGQDEGGRTPAHDFPDDLDLDSVQYKRMPRSRRERAKVRTDQAPAPASEVICPTCGEATNPGALHCVRCGADMRGRRKGRRRAAKHRPVGRNRFAVHLPFRKIAIALVLVGGPLALWQLVIRPTGETFSINRAFEYVWSGEDKYGIARLEEIKDGVSSRDRDLVELRIDQARLVAGRAHPDGVEVVVHPIGMSDLHVEERGTDRVCTFSVVNRADVPLVLTDDYFFLLALASEVDIGTGVVVQQAAKVAAPSSTKASTVDNVEVPAGATLACELVFPHLPHVILPAIAAGPGVTRATKEVRSLQFVFNDGTQTHFIPIER